MKPFLMAALFLALAATLAHAQINSGAQQPEASVPFTMTQVTPEAALADCVPARRADADY